MRPMSYQQRVDQDQAAAEAARRQRALRRRLEKEGHPLYRRPGFDQAARELKEQAGRDS